MRSRIAFGPTGESQQLPKQLDGEVYTVWYIKV